jgi:DNA-binding NarL/FixJ family response regulator
MPNAFQHPQSDSAIRSRLPHLLAAVVRLTDAEIARRVRVRADDAEGIVVRLPNGAAVESIESLQILLGLKPTWRRPIVAGHEMSDRDALVQRRIGQGRTTREVAVEIGVSERTVTTLRRRLRERDTAPEVGSGSRGVSVLGAPSLTRDLVHAVLQARRDDLNPPGVAHADDRVRVLVTPTTRTLSFAGGARLVIVGALPDGVTMLDAVRSGTLSQLPMTTTVSALLSAVDGAMVGDVSMTSRAVKELVDQIYVPGGADGLTQREADVIDGIRLGESVKQTARRLGVSPKTVENRRNKMFVRFGVRSARELERAAGPLTEGAALGSR